MIIKVLANKRVLGDEAALYAVRAIRLAIEKNGTARIIAATGASQFEFLEVLTKSSEVDWEKVEMFHLDEYVGLPAEHPASFRKYLRERLIDKTGIRKFHLLDGEANPEDVCLNVGRALSAAPIDVAFVGIGENGHLAFNDPPADFEVEKPYIVVRLDEACRRQQVGEGWFAQLSDVPKTAITMTIRQLLKSKSILCIVPDTRKARALKTCFEGQVNPMAPASILRTHSDTTVFLDPSSAQLLDPKLISRND